MPSDGDADVSVRADFIRHLISGGDQSSKLHSKGILLRGARITGTLDLQGADCPVDLSFGRCWFDEAPSFVNARMRGVFFTGTHLPGMHADNCVFEGSVYLRADFRSSDEIAMPNAQISGDLQICGAKIASDSGFGIFATSLRVGGSVYLGDYPFDDKSSELTVDGTIEMSSISVSRDFYCCNCALSAAPSINTQKMVNDRHRQNAPTAISLSRGSIGGVLYIRDNQISQGMVNLSNAVARRLNDEPVGETIRYPLRLDGFEYDGLSTQSSTALADRLEWLERRPQHIGFSAQPFEHLASILNKLGHRNDANDVLMRKEKLQRAEDRAVLRASGHSRWRLPLMVLSDGLLRGLIGYGYRPVRAVLWGGILVALFAMFFHKVWISGDMAPNSAPILISADWISATQSHSDNPALYWSRIGGAGQDYETFNAMAYAADLLIPIVNFGQEDAWAPSTSRSPWGWHAWWLRWFVKISGWVVTALGAAAVTGAIRKL
ncbi:oxidoreductase [Amylibacter marinus]|uniref:Oxidoreductase n=1 Tax=Amylibacter marinus TaxID=1475483 RepID=A0ABQ5VVC0_9RHOB|nr:hypothetical protein [Amylibacter marinus]GLQ35280.1 oxidoreductase [Amylibacter marinus]